MATAPLVFPLLPSGKSLDAAKFETSAADPGMRQETDGGYVITRARYTRKPRKSWKCALTNITGADKIVMDDFWDTTRGTARAFSWVCPTDMLTYNVRFKASFSMTHRGAGATQFWDCSFELEQV